MTHDKDLNSDFIGLNLLCQNKSTSHNNGMVIGNNNFNEINKENNLMNSHDNFNSYDQVSIRSVKDNNDSSKGNVKDDFNKQQDNFPMNVYQEDPRDAVVDNNIIHESDLDLNNFKQSNFINELEIWQSMIENKKIILEDFLNSVQSIADSLDGLSKDEKICFVKMLSKFKKLFTKKSTSADIVPYKVRVKPHNYFIRKTYPISLAYGKAVNGVIDDMLKAGVIERMDSSYCNALRVVIKQDKSVRVCLDA